MQSVEPAILFRIYIWEWTISLAIWWLTSVIAATGHLLCEWLNEDNRAMKSSILQVHGIELSYTTLAIGLHMYSNYHTSHALRSILTSLQIQNNSFHIVYVSQTGVFSFRLRQKNPVDWYLRDTPCGIRCCLKKYRRYSDDNVIKGFPSDRTHFTEFPRQATGSGAWKYMYLLVKGT